MRTLGKQSSEKTEQEIGDRTGTKAKERDSNVNKKRSEKDEQKKASSFSLSLSLKNKWTSKQPKASNSGRKENGWNVTEFWFN